MRVAGGANSRQGRQISSSQEATVECRRTLGRRLDWRGLAFPSAVRLPRGMSTVARATAARTTVARAMAARTTAARAHATGAHAWGAHATGARARPRDTASVV